MHGLINRALQFFLSDTYGVEAWHKIAFAARIGHENFEALLSYDVSQTDAVLAAATDEIGSPRDDLLMDLGTYLIADKRTDGIRRLLRFGGDNFVEFMHSLDELPDRARLAVSDLELPKLELLEHSSFAYSLLVTHKYQGFGHVAVGLMRAMADDYGALAFFEFKGRRDGVETISIDVLDASFSKGRDFALIAGAA